MRSLYGSLRGLLCKLFTMVIVPNFCALCDQLLYDTPLLCPSCLKKIQPVASKTIAASRKRAYTVHALSLYRDEFKPLVHAKFYGNRALCQELGTMTWQHSTIRSSDFDIIVPIPLHWTRYAWRGFNQAEEMAKALSRQSGKPIVHFLKRVRKTNYQSLLNKKERSLNLQAAFQIALSVEQYNGYKNARILIVDDLYTTGSTIEEAIRTINVKTHVHVLVAFRT